MRLQKYLAHAGVCSRRKAEGFILDGRVRVNGQVVTELGTQVDPDSDTIHFDDRRIRPAKKKKIYIALHKPAGYVTTCAQENTRIVMDLVDLKERVYPVGRLDKDSTGLLLLTNDGDLHNRMSHPSFDHEKEYRVSTVRPIQQAALNRMAKGMKIDGKLTRPAVVSRVSDAGFTIILKQGMNRQIRKMVAKTGNRVKTLKRVRMAHIHLGRLKPGKWRYLNTQEIAGLTQ